MVRRRRLARGAGARHVDPKEITQRKGAVVVNFVKKDAFDAFIKQEGQRCLECNYVCAKCVDVCPNRAGQRPSTVPARQGEHQPAIVTILNFCLNRSALYATLPT